MNNQMVAQFPSFWKLPQIESFCAKRIVMSLLNITEQISEASIDFRFWRQILTKYRKSEMQWHISDSIKNLLRKRADFRKMFMATQSLSDFRFWKGSSTRFWFRCCFSKSSCIFQMLWGPVADLRFHQNLMRTMGRFWVAPKRLIRFQILNGAYSKFCGGRCHSRIWSIFQILRVWNPYFRKCCQKMKFAFLASLLGSDFRFWPFGECQISEKYLICARFSSTPSPRPYP